MNSMHDNVNLKINKKKNKNLFFLLYIYLKIIIICIVFIDFYDNKTYFCITIAAKNKFHNLLHLPYIIIKSFYFKTS